MRTLSFYSFRYLPSFSCSLISSLSVFLMAGCACTDIRQPEVRRQKEAEEIAEAGILPAQSTIEKAIAHVKSFKGDQIKGTVVFTKVSDGIKIEADVEGLSPGQHGFHVHEFGNCSGEGEAAGAHFNPTHSQHGGPDSPVRHVGDLGNLVANEEGRAHYERVDSIIRFEGENSIIGRSIIIHADPDDYKTQPSGASGAKIACGIIEAVTQK